MDASALHPGSTASFYPLSRHEAQDVVAVQAGHAVTRGAFMADVAALAALLPDHTHILNCCADRYRFLVGFAAALSRGQISLMAPGDVPWMLQALAGAYPGLYGLTDGAPLPLPALDFPRTLAPAGSAPPPPVSLPAAQPALILFTSGSTGQPKPVPKDWGTLVRSARAAGARLGISRLRGATLVSTVPHQHSYGLESILLLALQHGLIIDAGWPRYPADIRAALGGAPRPRILVTAPVHIKALLAEPEPLPEADLILSATAPLPAALAAEAEARFGAPLVEIYGCTEAGQVATRATAHETQWRCLEGISLQEDEQGSWASGPAVAGRALLHDRIERTGPEHFLLGERSADLVDVAGKRTSLAHLNHQLLSITGVRDGVFLMGESCGARVARLMALAVAPDMRPETILRALRDRIDPVFLPRPLLIVDELPRNTLGKLPREALLRLAGRGQGA